MTSKKRRQRGSRTHGGGTHKNRRGAGHRGGRGDGDGTEAKSGDGSERFGVALHVMIPVERGLRGTSIGPERLG